MGDWGVLAGAKPLFELVPAFFTLAPTAPLLLLLPPLSVRSLTWRCGWRGGCPRAPRSLSRPCSWRSRGGRAVGRSGQWGGLRWAEMLPVACMPGLLHILRQARPSKPFLMPCAPPACPALPCRYCAGNYRPEMPPLEELEPGAFHLVEVDARYRRTYARRPTAAS